VPATIGSKGFAGGLHKLTKKSIVSTRAHDADALRGVCRLLDPNPLTTLVLTISKPNPSPNSNPNPYPYPNPNPNNDPNHSQPYPRLLDRLPGDFRAVFTEDAAATGAEAVRAGVADGGGGGQRGVQADLVLADFAPLLRDRLASWTLPVRACSCHGPAYRAVPWARRRN